jgi:hypothetical protein
MPTWALTDLSAIHADVAIDDLALATFSTVVDDLR